MADKGTAERMLLVQVGQIPQVLYYTPCAMESEPVTDGFCRSAISTWKMRQDYAGTLVLRAVLPVMLQSIVKRESKESRRTDGTSENLKVETSRP